MPEDGVDLSTQDADLDVERAQLLIDANRFQAALDILRRQPENVGARLLSAVALQCLERNADALVEVESAIALEPDEPNAQWLRSDILLHLGRTKESLLAAREAIRLEPGKPYGHVVLARAAAKAHDWTTAEAAAAEAIRIDPEWAETHGAAGYVALERGRKKDAERHLREALRLEPANATHVNNLALTTSRFRPPSKGVELLEAAVAADPTDKAVVDNLYLYAAANAQGRGFDRLDLLLLPTSTAMGLLVLVILFGWIHLPIALTVVVFGLFVVLLVLYAVLDLIRNRRRLRSMQPQTQALLRRRFRWDLMVSFLYFVITFGVPILTVAIIDSALGLPGVVQWLIVFVLILAWALIGPRMWNTRVRFWVGSKR